MYGFQSFNNIFRKAWSGDSHPEYEKVYIYLGVGVASPKMTCETSHFASANSSERIKYLEKALDGYPWLFVFPCPFLFGFGHFLLFLKAKEHTYFKLIMMQ